MIDWCIHLHPLDIGHQLGNPLLHFEALATAANVLALQRHHHHLGRGDHTGIEQLQHHPIPALAGAAVESIGCVAQLAGGGAQADGGLRETALELGGDGVDVQVRRDEARDQRRREALGG